MQLPIVTLWDIMRRFHAWQLARALSALDQIECDAKDAHRQGMRDALVPSERIEKYVAPMIAYCRRQCEAVELTAAVACIDDPDFRLPLKHGITFDQLRTQVRVLRNAIGSELCYRRFAYVQTARAKVLDEMAGAWATVWQQFPSAKQDSEEAVYCYALERHTACVFHLMRVAEFGLRALARELKIRLPRKKPLEWAQWQDIIKEMVKKADNIAATRRAGPQKDAALEFYRGAIGQFQGFKDEYRNNVMHTRVSHDEYKAASVLTHVLDFMKKLSARIDENGHRV